MISPELSRNPRRERPSILVKREGRITGEIKDVRSATQEQVLALAMAPN